MKALDLPLRALTLALVFTSVAFLLAPLLVACLLSFDNRSFLGPFPPKDFSFRWYRAFFANPSYLDGFWISVQVAAIASAVSTTIGTMTALALAEPRLKIRDTVENPSR
jgi:putative spermidine/putrescine transport system permease protein